MATLFIVPLSARPALAQDWKFTPFVSAAATASDNSNQSATDPQSALILSVTPGFNLASEGSRRIKASLGYSLTGIVRVGGNDQSDDINHNLNATGKAELIDDFLFIDGNANVSQQLISLLGSPSDASTNSANRATVGTYSLSPYIQKRLGTFAVAQARLTHAGAIFQNDVAATSMSDTLTASLKSGTRFNDVSWSLDYSLRKADNSATSTTQSNTTTFETVSGTLGYALTRKFRVFGTAGRDSNDFVNASASNGDYYSAGFGWSPTQRTSLEASAGKRFNGNSYALSMLHRTHNSNWNVRYSEDVSDQSQRNYTESSRAFISCLDGSFQELFNLNAPTPTGCTRLTSRQVLSELLGVANSLGVTLTQDQVLATGLINSSLAQGVFIIKNLTSGVSWAKGKLGTGLSVFDTRRNFILVGNLEDHTRGISGNVNYRLNPHTSVSSTLSLSNNQIPAGLGTAIDRDDNLYSASVSLTHSFDPKLSGVLTLRHQQRDSNDPASSYDENSITASVTKRF